MSSRPTAEWQQAYDACLVSDLVDKARKVHEAAVKKVAKLSADIEQAQQALAAARKVSEDAVAGIGKLSPLAAEEAIDDADRKLRVAQKLLAQAEKERDEAEAGIREAELVGHGAAYRAGAVLRFRACLQVQAARKMAEDAQTLYDRSSWQLNTAARYGGGMLYGSPGHGAHHPPHDLEKELLQWRAVRDTEALVEALVEEAKAAEAKSRG